MERARIINYIKRHARGATAALAIASAASVLVAPLETYAQNPSPERPAPSPTPTLKFDTPGSIHPNQQIDSTPPSFTPIFAPLPVTAPPEWTGDARVSFYCLPGETASQTPVRNGVIATDPKVIPTGSRVRIEDLGDDLSAEDTGSAVVGRRIDFWVSSCEKAKELGVMFKRFKVMRWGW